MIISTERDRNKLLNTFIVDISDKEMYDLYDKYVEITKMLGDKGYNNLSTKTTLICWLIASNDEY